jgi:pimeloyl-ACP methyl ester carboxylesterase
MLGRLERFRLSTSAPRPYAGFRSTCTPVRGFRMHARVGGGSSGLPVVLVHGLAVSHRYLMPTAALLGRRHPVAAPDLPGFGLSEDPGRVLGTRELADRLGEWLRATFATPVVLLGNSYGCQVLVDLVVRDPSVAVALVLSGPTVDPGARSETRQVLRWLADAVREDPLQAPILLRDVRDAGPPRVFATLRHAVEDRIEDKLPAVPVPTLVTRGGIEPIVPPHWARQAAGLLPAGRLVVLPGSPHNSVYTHAGALAAATEDFLARTVPTAPE